MPEQETILARPVVGAPDLVRQFVLSACGVLVAGMAAVGVWLTHEIERGVIDNAAAVTALHVDAIIAPVTQGVGSGDTLSPEMRAALQALLGRAVLRREIWNFKLWSLDGHVLYSADPAVTGRQYGVNPRLRHALDGGIYAALRQGPHTGDSIESPTLLEIYSPVRSTSDGRVIAVAEFYTRAEGLEKHLWRARLKTWGVMAAVGLVMLGVLSLVFLRGNRTIAQQRRALDEKVGHLSALLARNHSLTEGLAQANRRIADLHERTMRKVAAELHDGPAQTLAFAALRLDSPGGKGVAEAASALREAMEEIRHICRGVALPELQSWDLARIVTRLVGAHEERTGCRVALSMPDALPEPPVALRECVYRFVQEALNNSAKHAPGARRWLDVGLEREALVIAVRDDGPGFDPELAGDGLGLIGMRERIAALRGRLMVEAAPGQGVRLVMVLPLDGEAPCPGS